MENWYYVQKGNRQGPVSLEVIETMLAKQELGAQDYVWKKGFENWKRIKEVPELAVRSEPAAPPMPEIPKAPEPEENEQRLMSLDQSERILFVRIGQDRGAASSEYGPFNAAQLKQLYKENRINGKTYLYVKGMKDYKLLADFPDFEQFFEDRPPVIQEVERRKGKRRPFVARMFFQNNKSIFEGVCRDISIGGMQILTDEFHCKAGDKISINVHPENTEYHFTASGIVVRILEGNSGFSFRFEALSDEAKSAIERYIQQN